MRYLTGFLTGLAFGMNITYWAMKPAAAPAACSPIQGPYLEELKPGMLRVGQAYDVCFDGHSFRLILKSNEESK